MKIQELFSKDIFRAINGVVKAEQQDAEAIWQELDEFVVTKELLRHFDRFFSVYSDAIERPGEVDVSGTIGVWVSGFFGSGKSHFIKALSYLFSNNEVAAHGKKRRAIEFFEEKIDDALLFGTIKNAVAKETDVILFNIDSKADQSKGKDAILAVFLKVLNELQGYSPDHPHIAHMERYLERKGKLELFQNTYQDFVGGDWKEQRDSYMFNQDEIVKSLAKTLGQSEESCHRWIDNAESDFSLSVENFAGWVKEYLDSKGPIRRIFFFVDEIGQFIGQDGHRMLNLQTIIENLGVACSGRAWVVVTSQEDIDKVLGSFSNARTNDFSKILGRFKTRLSLSSANVDEVIQTRILKKKTEVVPELKGIYNKNADILKNQLSFTKIGMTLTPYISEDDFVKNYPFIPYQFILLQKVFETIRKAGATGLHLARGERSMLDAFQIASQIVAHKDTGVLIPLYFFYKSIESWLDTVVLSTMEQAGENPSLHEYDVLMLETLFMIRYIDEIKGSVDNLVTLCISSIDDDRLALRKKIEESLRRLEKETLIGKSDENYFFLTNEEQDISRQIKNVELDFGEESRLFGDIIFADILKDNKKHRYSKTGKDFSLNRLCDKRTVGSRIEQGLLISTITPFCEDYKMYEPARCIGESTDEGGCIIIRLPDTDNLTPELRTYLKTEKYIRRKNDGNPEVERILRDRKNENRDRRGRLIEMTTGLLADAEYYVAGQKLAIDTVDTTVALYRACDYLIDNTFSKMNYIEQHCSNPQMEIQSVLRADDMAQIAINMTLPAYNSRAIAEMRVYIDLCTRTSKQIVMYDLVETKFSGRPYGWPEWETALLLARMLSVGEIQLVMNNSVIDRHRIFEIIPKISNWKKVTIKQRKKVDKHKLENMRKIGQEMFGEMGPDNEDDLFLFLKSKIGEWENKLKQYQTLADTGNYPGGKEIGEGLRLTSILLAARESFLFMERFDEIKDELKDFSEDFHDIDNFYQTQRPVWERLRNNYAHFKLNALELEKNEVCRKALSRMGEILEAQAPYSLIQEIDAYIDTVNKTNEKLITSFREKSLAEIDKMIRELSAEAEKASQDVVSICKPLDLLKEAAVNEVSLAHFKQIEARALSVFDGQIQKLSELGNESTKEQTVKIKSIKEVSAGSFSKKSYIETEEDVEEFLGGLKKEILEALKKGNKIRIV